MSETGKRLFVPLGSNAHSLVLSGSGDNVEAVRKRLKFASITFDEILLEAGTLNVNAGPTGSSSMRHSDDEAQFQTGKQRASLQASEFAIALGREDVSGQAATEMHEFIRSSNTFGWAATLRPFEKELPTGCDWVRFVNVGKDGNSDRAAKAWRRTDELNDSLLDVLPDKIVRSVVLGAANSDLADGAYGGVAVMQDGLHQQVLQSRFNDRREAGWQATGFALPIHLPDVSGLDWNAVARIRKNKHMADFRKILADIESQALDEAIDADVREVVHRAFARYLSEAVPKVEGLGAMAKDMVASLAIGRMASVVTVAFGGPAALPVAMAMDAGPSLLEGQIDKVRGRKHRWTSVYQEITAATNARSG